MRETVSQAMTLTGGYTQDWFIKGIENPRSVDIQAGSLSAEQTSQGNISLCIFKFYSLFPELIREISLYST